MRRFSFALRATVVFTACMVMPTVMICWGVWEIIFASSGVSFDTIVMKTAIGITVCVLVTTVASRMVRRRGSQCEILGAAIAGCLFLSHVSFWLQACLWGLIVVTGLDAIANPVSIPDSDKANSGDGHQSEVTTS